MSAGKLLASPFGSLAVTGGITTLETLLVLED
jgi:hypothetical protein